MKFLILIVSTLVLSINGKIPDYIHRCAKKDPAVNTCIANSINALRPILKKGIPELDVPSIEPFRMQPIQLKIGSRGTNITNISVWGASDYQILKLRANLVINEFKYEVVIPKLLLEGLYEIDTSILLLKIQGNGPVKINIKNYRFNCTMKSHPIKKQGVTHMEFEKMKCAIAFDNASIKLENLFQGNELLGNVTNTVINDNVDLFFEEVKPKIIDEITSVFTTAANKITLRFPYEELFL